MESVRFTFLVISVATFGLHTLTAHRYKRDELVRFHFDVNIIKLIETVPGFKTFLTQAYYRITNAKKLNRFQATTKFLHIYVTHSNFLFSASCLGCGFFLCIIL